MFNKLLIFVVLVFCFSCEEQGIIVKCSDCTLEEPFETELDIKLEEKYQGSQILINIYEGNLEDSVLYHSFTTGSPRPSITVTVNKKYTVTSTYYSQGTSYIAVDSATPRVTYNKDQCDEPCYFVYDRTIDLRLKYY
jgi:hypothetical protein